MQLGKHFGLVIFDWAGTMVDFGCRAPAEALIEVFGRRGVVLSEADVRRDMGKAKADHVRALLQEPSVARAWTAATGAHPDTLECDRLIAELGPLMLEKAARASTLITGARRTVDELRAAGLKIGSSTGYTREMMQPVLRSAAEQGYVPDHLVCSGETPQGRPSPLMIYKACAELGVWPLNRVVKVDDSEAGVAEGRNAGCLTVGLSASGNAIGLSQTALAALSADVRRARIEAASQALYGAGADVVIESVAELTFALEHRISEQLRS